MKLKRVKKKLGKRRKIDINANVKASNSWKAHQKLNKDRLHESDRLVKASLSFVFACLGEFTRQIIKL